MSISLSRNPALLLIDMQKGFLQLQHWGTERNHPDAEEKAGTLLQIWRHLGLPVFHIQHSSQNPASPLHADNTGHDFIELVTPLPTEMVIKKNVNSAFIGTDLLDKLHQAAITQIVIVGLTTDHCVSTTARMAANLGFEIFLVGDATATFDRKTWDEKYFSAAMIHETALASLHEEFATIITTATLADLLSTRVV